MVKIKKVDPSVIDRPRPTRGVASELTPAQRERRQQQRQFTRLMEDLNDTDTVFEVRLGKEEKAVTVRQRILKAAQDTGKEVAVRKSPNGFVVGLMTPERRSTRGRKKAGASA
jgi:hypothetical protein